MPPEPARGLTVDDIARRYCVSADKVRSWIQKGELTAVNVASSLCGRPQLRIVPEALAAFEEARSAAPPPKPPRRRRTPAMVDYFPD
ncbi:MAG TPA: helix-turn-helix domain-containing protein [Gemmataceae bacterium]|nr:helix-turn-helix domain-containing protein [Gemmataceae bacterium]